MSQLALPLKLADYAVFASFLADGNEPAVALLEEIAGQRRRDGAWLWGAVASGKSHLLQATCENAGERAMYLPLAMLDGSTHEMLEGLEDCTILCIDDIDRVAGRPAWEQAFFSLYNGLEERDHALVLASTASPRDVGFELPDLLSRLRRLPAFHLRPLDDERRAAALKLRAWHRGLELPDETARYLLKRNRRDMRSLYALLDTLDSAALSQQRRLTVPFVKTVLESR